MLAIFATAFTAYLPNADYMKLSQRLGQWIKSNAAKNETVGMVRYSQPTVSFYQDCELRQLSPNVLVNDSPATWPDYIIMPQDVYDDFLKENPQKGIFLQKATQFTGLNYNTDALSDLYSRVGEDFGPDYPTANSALRVQTVLILRNRQKNDP